MFTPWGHADSVQDIGRGILRVDTPSHGGYFVPCLLRGEIPAPARKPFAGPGWYEEDCDWCMVALSFPDLFKPEHIEAARETCRNWMTAEVCAAFGLEQSERNVKKQEAEEAKLLAQGEWLRCAALGCSVGPNPRARVHVLFRNRAGDTIGYYMDSETYDAIPLMQTATPRDYARIEGRTLEPAPGRFHAEKGGAR